jgi:hypothetical protein
MSASSGVFTKYVIEFVDAKFKVSNDVSAISAGDFLLDADVTVTMGRDTAGTTFTIIVYNLPQNQLDILDAAINPKNYLQSVKVQLGYFETKVQLVVDGIYEKIESKVAADSTTGQNRLVTTISGKEKALRACSDAKYSCTLSDDNAADLASAAKSVLSEVASKANKTAHPGIDKLVDQTIHITGGLTGKTATTFNNNSILTVLAEMASNAKSPSDAKSASNKSGSNAKAELLLVDGKVYLGAPIEYDPDPPGASGITFDPSVNLAQFSKVKVNVKPKKDSNTKAPTADQADAPTDSTIRAFSFTALGDPTMRPGQKVTLSSLTAPTFSGLKDPTFPEEFRINTVTHQLSGSAGYICTGEAVDAANVAAAREAIKPSAAGGAQDVASAIKSEAGKNPVIEVASVKAAADKDKYPYQADLYYGQTRKDEQQPSIEVAITSNDCQVYRHRPIASPFAWRKCGLVTPVYPVMKALVAHNAGLATDGIVTGYTWSKLPDLPPPPNEPGDWWLCLPMDVDAKSLLPPDAKLTAQDEKGNPTFDWGKDWKWDDFDKTKAVNDLTSHTGKRIIEVKGLKITVGASKLATIGTRPSEGPDDDFLIEHASGTSIHIDSNGALTIDASNASLTIKGNVVIEGSLEIK